MSGHRHLDIDRGPTGRAWSDGIVDMTAFPHGSGAEVGAHQVYSLLLGMWTPAIVEAAHDLGLWTALASGTGELDVLAAELAVDREALRSLLRALIALSLVEMDVAQTYRIAEGLAPYLVPGGPWSMAGKMTHDLNVAWAAWRGVAEMIRRPSQGEARTDNKISSADYVQLVPSLNFMAPPAISQLSAWLREHRWRNVAEQRSMLDIGCGSGIYSQLMLSEWPALTSVGLDMPEVASLARAHAQATGVGDRFTTHDGDFWSRIWPSDQDLVLVANILHTRTEAQALRLVHAAARSLAPEGVVVFVDMFDSAGTPQDSRDRFAALFGMSMLATGGGSTYSVECCDSWIRQTGLETLSVIDNPINRTIIAGRAP